MSTTAQTHAARAMAYAFARNVASMQAAYIDWTRGDGADHGMAWIGNTLCGPGLLPEAGSATAQEFFDCEMEKLDKLYPDVTMNPPLPSPAWCASVDAELAATAEADARALPDAARLFDAANRLVTHADYKLGGILSADSKARDIPSNACSQVKARHLAALRDAVNAFGEADQGHTPTLPAAAVAEGLERDGDALEQAS